MHAPDAMMVFDRALVRRHRDRAAAGPNDHDFLFAETADRLMERLTMVRRPFASVLDLGSRRGVLTRMLGARTGTTTVIAADPAPAMARLSTGPAIAAEAEFLPFAEGCFDLVASNGALHWVNDLPGALVQVRRCLRPDGLFLACLFGGETLSELRRCLLEAELALTGGISPRVSPFAGLRDAAGLLQRAGFALPVADSDTLTVTYADAFALLRDLRGMGETNALLTRHRRPATRALFLEAARRYQAEYAESDGRIVATFEVLFLSGWAPAASQPQPLRPGSAARSLAEALGTCEMPAGDLIGRG